MISQRRIRELESKVRVKSIDVIPTDFAEFNALIGMPKSKIPPYLEMPLYQYELEMASDIKSYKYYALNKARGIGATELVLRLILHMAALNVVPGRKFLIVAGTRSALARDHLKRMAELCRPIQKLVKIDVSDERIKINNSEIIAIPANPSAIRGYENVGLIFADEAAHWDMLDDDVVLEAIEPHRTKSDANIVIVSTPNGQRGFFYNIFNNPNTKYHAKTIPWHVASELISAQEVELIKNEDRYRFEQEYNCQFLSSQYAAFPPEVLDMLEENSEVYQLDD